jgi:tRNA (mo5U34)-methyltransferase
VEIEEARALVSSVPHWHHQFEIFPGVRTPGSYDPAFMWQFMKETAWAGHTVLDLGPADGAFSLWAAQGGAHVTAVDYRPKTVSGFSIMEQLSGRSFNFEVSNIYNILPSRIGQFDIVMFLGVLYHLADPLRGLHVCRSVCRERLFLETWYANDLPEDQPLVKYVPYEDDTDFTNFWAPNAMALQLMVQDAGFEIVTSRTWGPRMFIEATVSHDAPRQRRMAFAYADNVTGL